MDYYRQHGRHDLPWRKSEAGGIFNTYHILASEVMLQQTQVSRVIPKYQAFLALFPDVQALADAPLNKVLGAWLGLGYNRRARYLWEAAGQLAGIPEPWTESQLVACKGIGVNTARAVLVYSYNLPLAFVETNVRSVIIHHFFPGQDRVADKDILGILTELEPVILQKYAYREWYWALMDYGTHLKRTAGNAAARSTAHTRQPPFEGSRRQLRGKILRLLHEDSREYSQLLDELQDDRAEDVLRTLQEEKLVYFHDNMLMLYNGFDDSLSNH